MAGHCVVSHAGVSGTNHWKKIYVQSKQIKDINLEADSRRTEQ